MNPDWGTQDLHPPSPLPLSCHWMIQPWDMPNRFGFRVLSENHEILMQISRNINTNGNQHVEFLCSLKSFFLMFFPFIHPLLFLFLFLFHHHPHLAPDTMPKAQQVTCYKSLQRLRRLVSWHRPVLDQLVGDLSH